MSSINVPVEGLILRTVSVPKKVKKVRTRKRLLLGRIAVIGLILAFTGIAGSLGAGFGPSGSGSSASADFISDSFCKNPRTGDNIIPQAWPGGAIGLLGGAASFTSGNVSQVVAKATKATSESARNAYSSQMTAYEWYGTTGITWNDYGWSDANFPDPVKGCTLVNNVLNFIPNMILSLNTIIGGFTVSVLGWVTSWNIVQVFFGAAGGVLPTLVTSLKTTLFLNYLVPIVFLSTLYLAFQAIVKGRARESLQGIVWMVLAAAGSLIFMTNPVWFASGADNAVYTTSGWIISATAQAGSGGSAATNNSNNICYINPKNSTDSANNLAVREIQCSLWQTFIYTPWAAGQMGTDAMAVTVPSSSSAPVGASFRGSTLLPIVVLDSNAIDRVDVQSGALNNGGASAIVDQKNSQWKAGVVPTYKNPTAANQQAITSGEAMWTGTNWVGRFTTAIVGLTAQGLALVPTIVLGFGLLFQQIVFVLLLTAAPVFLTIGINPGFGRKIALGWLEMILATMVKRLLTAGLLGILLGYFGAVISSTPTLSTLTGGSSLAGINNATDVWGFTCALLAAGAIAIFVLRGRLLKQAGSLIDLNGQRVNDHGMLRGMLGTLGAAGAGALIEGTAHKLAGGSFGEGAQPHLSRVASTALDKVPGSQHIDTAKRGVERGKAFAAERNAAADIPLETANWGEESESTQQGSSTRQVNTEASDEQYDEVPGPRRRGTLPPEGSSSNTNWEDFPPPPVSVEAPQRAAATPMRPIPASARPEPIPASSSQGNNTAPSWTPAPVDGNQIDQTAPDVTRNRTSGPKRPGKPAGPSQPPVRE